MNAWRVIVQLGLVACGALFVVMACQAENGSDSSQAGADRALSGREETAAITPRNAPARALTASGLSPRSPTNDTLEQASSRGEKNSVTVLAAVGQFSRGGAAYTSYELPAAYHTEEPLDFVVSGARYGVAIRGSLRHRLYVRLVGQQHHTGNDVIVTFRKSGKKHRLRLGDLGTALEAPDLETRFFLDASRYFQSQIRFASETWPEGLGLLKYFSGRLEMLASGEVGPNAIVYPPSGTSSEAAPYNLMGGTFEPTVEAASLFARGLGRRPFSKHRMPARGLPKAWVAPAVDGAIAATHAVDETTRCHGRYSLAQSLPKGGAFFGGSHLIDDVSLLRRWGTPHIVWAESVLSRLGMGFRWAGHLEHMLIDASHLEAKGLGELASYCTEWAVYLDDPFVSSGAGTILAVRTRDVRGVLGWLKSARRAALRRATRFRQGEWSEAGVAARFYQAGSEQHQQHVAVIEDVVLVSNSEAVLRRALSETRPQAQTSPESDYCALTQKMVAASSGSEGVHMYLPRSFWQKLKEPSWRISMWRKAVARADLLQVRYAALLYRWLQGELPSDVRAMNRLGVLHRDESMHYDGVAIDYEPRLGATSSWGQPEYMRPVADISTSGISADEEAAFSSYVRSEAHATHRAPSLLLQLRDEDGFTLRAWSTVMEPKKSSEEISRRLSRTRLQSARGRVRDAVELELGISEPASLVPSIAALLPEWLEVRKWVGPNALVGLRVTESTPTELFQVSESNISVQAWLRANWHHLVKQPMYCVLDVADVLVLADVMERLYQRLTNSSTTPSTTAVRYQVGPLYGHVQSIVITTALEDPEIDWRTYVALSEDRLVLATDSALLGEVLEGLKGEDRPPGTHDRAHIHLQTAWGGVVTGARSLSTLVSVFGSVSGVSLGRSYGFASSSVGKLPLVDLLADISWSPVSSFHSVAAAFSSGLASGWEASTMEFRALAEAFDGLRVQLAAEPDSRRDESGGESLYGVFNWSVR